MTKIPQTIISDGLMSLVDLYAGERQAQLDLEIAQAKKAAGGRTIVPGVQADLAAFREKERKRKEQAQKQGQSQAAATMPSMVPPTVDTTGQVGGRSGNAGAAQVAEGIQKLVSGGAGVKTGQIGGAVGGMLGAGSQAALGVGQAALAKAQPTDLQRVHPQQAQVQAGITPIPSPTQGGAAPTSPAGPGFFSQLGDIAKKVVMARMGIQQQEPLTPDEQASQLSPGLSVLVGRTYSDDPAVAQSAREELTRRGDQIEGELGKETKAAAMRQAQDLWMLRQEDQRMKEEDPLEQARRGKAQLEFGIEQEVAEFGIDHLSPGRRAVWERGRRDTNVNVTNVNQMERSTKGFMEKKLDDNQQVMQYIQAFDDAYFAPGYELLSPVDRKQLQLKDATGILTEEEATRLRRYADQDAAVSRMNLAVLHPLLGTQLSTGEMKLAGELIVSMKKGGITAKAAADGLRDMVSLSLFRYETVLEAKSNVDPRYSMGLGNVKEAARKAIIQHQKNLESYMDEATAVQQTRDDFKGRYGMDVDRILGTQ